MELNRFCAECGKQGIALHDHFCQKCHWRYNKLASPDKTEFEFTICNECFSVKLPSGWTAAENLDVIPKEIGYAAIKYLRVEDDTYVELGEITDVDWSNPKPEFAIHYEVRSHAIEIFEEHQESHVFSVSIGKGICKACVAKKSGTGNSIVQLRAQNRELTLSEKEKYGQLASKISTDELSENPQAYISDVYETHGGLDFYFGNQYTANSFVAELQKLIIGHKEKNFKLITEDKKGQRVYSITYLYRIPEVKPGDIISYNEELHNVIVINSKTIKLRSLVTNEKTSVSKWKSLTFLRNQPSSNPKMVISKDDVLNTYIFMDMQSYENEEIDASRFPTDLPIGAEIDLWRWNEKYYLPI